MTLREIKKSAKSLPPRQLMKLDAWLHGLLTAMGSKKRAGATHKGWRADNRTYSLKVSNLPEIERSVGSDNSYVSREITGDYLRLSDPLCRLSPLQP